MGSSVFKQNQKWKINPTTKQNSFPPPTFFFFTPEAILVGVLNVIPVLKLQQINCSSSSPAATMKTGQNKNSNSYTSERSIMFGGNSQSSALQPSSAASTAPSAFTTSTVTSIDGVNFSEGELLLQVTPYTCLWLISDILIERRW